MNFYTTRNLVILALVQIIVITLGVLAAGTCWKCMTQFNMVGPLRELELICDFGWLAFALPIIWVTLAVLLIYGSWHYAISPWVRMMSWGGGLSA